MALVFKKLFNKYIGRGVIRLLLGYGGIEGIAKAFNIILSLTLAAVLSVSDYGIVATLIAIELVITEILLLGQNSFILRFFRISELARFEKNYIASKYIILVAAMLLLFAVALFPMKYFLSESKPGIKVSILLLIFGIYLQANVILYLMYLRSIEKIRYYGVLRVSGQVIKFFVAVFFIWYSDNPLYYPIGVVISGMLIFLIILYQRTEYWKPTLFVKGGVEWCILSENLKFGLPIAIHGVAGASYSIIDRIFLAQLADVDAVAIYNFALIQGTSVFFFINILALTLMPKFYSADILGPTSKKYLNKFLLYSILGMMILSILVYYVIFPISLNFVPGRYESGLNILPIIGLAMMANCASNYAVYKLTALKRVKLLPVITVLSLCMNAILNYIFIPSFGIIGAAYALLFTEAAYAFALNVVTSVYLHQS